jgi:NAD(P)-dependent dehydrogenase (short-subunit alcohol dehydrogenase family)
MTLADLRGKVAVVTGAGSGIGRAVAMRGAAEGMKVAIIDIDPDDLGETARLIQQEGGACEQFVVDVADRARMAQLAVDVEERLGSVDLLVNNAGVGMRGLAWERPYEDWDWVLGVNLWGAVHGIHEFVPRMVERGEPAHVVNTASIAGLITGPYSCLYTTGKFAVVGLSECLAADLAEVGSAVGVSVLCPGWVRTRIVDAARHRTHADAAGPSSKEQELEASTRLGVEAGMDPAVVAGQVFDAIRTGAFWVLTHDYSDTIRRRSEAILDAYGR